MSCHHSHGQQRSPHADTQGADYPQLNFSPGAKWIKNLTKDRLGQFKGGHFSDVNLESVLFTHRVDNQEHVKLQVWSAPGGSKPLFAEAMKQKFKPAEKGQSFGPSCAFTNHWFKVKLTIPGYWQQYERVQFEFDPGCEAMIFTTDGTPLQGITGSWGGDRRVEYILPPEARKRGTYDIVIEMSCNGMFGVGNGGDINPPDNNRWFRIASADLVVPNQEAWRLMWDFDHLRELVDNLQGNTPLQNKALVVANEIMNAFNKGDPSDIRRCRKLAEEIYGEGWEAKGAAIYDEGDKRAQVWGIGCHIDTAWLWPYRVTQQKTARSWATQIDLMERYPEHRFTCSSAQQFKWLEQQYPSLFKKIQAKVKSGQFQLIGGSWVENDGNIPSGEALVRQHLLGQRYFQSRFGKKCDTAWLPDSFGLTGSLPQIIRGAGMDYFFTQKLSWNNINRFPHTTFNWVGIDGTQVLCHMTPVDTYTAQASLSDVLRGVNNHKNLESSDTALLVFGNGDGGGGPLGRMLEILRRTRAVANNHKEVPSVSMGHSVEEFFDDLAVQTKNGKTLPNWHGELYLEFHRGTYTSHGSIKRGNRKSEILLRDAEHIATLASIYKSFAYPQQTINDSWEKVLLNQFHDVLPGSCIGMVYDDAEKLYSEVLTDGTAIIDSALSALVSGSTAFSPESLPKNINKASEIVAFNTTFFPRRDVIKLPVTGAASHFKSKVTQLTKDGKHGYALMDCPDGHSVGTLTPAVVGVNAGFMPVHTYTNGSDHFVMRNSSVQLTISKGRITSLIDVQLDRELIPKGETGGMVIFEDRPLFWDAWDVEIYHLEKANPLEFTHVEFVAEGPLRASVRASLLHGKSKIVVTISLDAITSTTVGNSRSMFVFDAVVDWRERHEFLKFELPLDIHSDTATYETQFGHVQRPTHKNTTWDAAKFEVCGHKFADLSEYGYGVALLSESKYGFSCQGNVLRMSLLRSATSPDAEQDQGVHKFSWAVMPHEGHFLQSDVAIAAYLFNSPVHVRHIAAQSSDVAPIFRSPFYLEGAPNVFLETVKRGEDDTFDLTDHQFQNKSDTTTVILRIYEALGGHASVKLRVASHIPLRAVYETNMLEEAGEELNIIRDLDGLQASTFKLSFRGFEVKTIKLVIGYAQQAPLTNKNNKRESKEWVTV